MEKAGKNHDGEGGEIALRDANYFTRTYGWACSRTMRIGLTIMSFGAFT
jgi:hypothetical protein